MLRIPASRIVQNFSIASRIVSGSSRRQIYFKHIVQQISKYSMSSNQSGNGRGQIKSSIKRLPNSGTVATVTISRANKLNALNSDLLTAIPRAFTEIAENNEDLVAVILTGEGDKSFIGGADIAEMASVSNPIEARSFITKVHKACQSIRDCPVPVIARVNGITLGAGLEIAASCDMRVASSTAMLGMPEVRLGVPSVVEAALLPGLIGWGRTRQLLLLGENILAEEAEKWGLLERVVAPEKLDEAVDEWVKSLNECGPVSIRNQKLLIRRWETVGLDAAIQLGVDHFGRSFETQPSGEKAEPVRLMGEFLLKQSQRKKSKL
ncbi:hypothetical protein FQN57_006799 [Myotisia sp. PD_48]|nr:hypothetical protein FQN57_006799 [Myotisia sp. PD_48]